jgi:hypothetical protein
MGNPTSGATSPLTDLLTQPRVTKLLAQFVFFGEENRRKGSLKTPTVSDMMPLMLSELIGCSRVSDSDGGVQPCLVLGRCRTEPECGV